MPSAEYDLRYLRNGIDLLESYLLSPDIYRPIGVNAPKGDTPYPQLTLGWLLLARQRANVTAITSPEKNEFARLDHELQSIRSRWRSAWKNKAAAEFSARLKLWIDFLQEYRNSPGSNYDRYSYEVTRRVMLQMLGIEVDTIPPSEQELLEGLDNLLRAMIIPNEFIWDANLKPCFQRKYFWYLYGNLPSNLIN